ncbi:MAG: hypothetical protein DMF95_10735 [Acidobacteria bacterium]|nr:MAG: hypothetical protein DMF94_26580 [Acidobacteriota bacterium]PYR50278.1 MAG: hypothetical protein DMF95_10735 [Acidobacteriota bacterium]
MFVGPWLLIPLGLVGFVTAAPKATRLEYLIWGSFVPVYAVAVAVFYVTDRYQLPMCGHREHKDTEKNTLQVARSTRRRRAAGASVSQSLRGLSKSIHRRNCDDTEI